MKEEKKMMLRITEREHCPKDIKRAFLDQPMAPQSFIDWHRNRAEDELTAICSYSGAEIHNQWMQKDGWFDGFEALHAIIETEKERLLKVKWNEGTQSFMYKRPEENFGWTLLSPEDMDNPEFVTLCNVVGEYLKGVEETEETEEKEKEEAIRLAMITLDV